MDGRENPALCWSVMVLLPHHCCDRRSGALSPVMVDSDWLADSLAVTFIDKSNISNSPKKLVFPHKSSCSVELQERLDLIWAN